MALKNNVLVMPCRDAEDSDRERQITENIDLVEVIARIVKRTHPRVAMQDLIAAGRLGLVQAARRWVPGKGACFRTFVAPRVRGNMVELVRRRNLREDSNLSLGNFSQFADPRASEATNAVERKRRVVSILEGMPPEDRRTIEMRFLEGRPMREVATALKVTSIEAGRRLRRSLEIARQVEEGQVEEGQVEERVAQCG